MSAKALGVALRRALLGLIAAIGLGGAAAADQMDWEVTSYYPYQVQLQFVSQSRSAAWPGDGQAYELNDDSTYSYSLNCESGELICYGAWATGDASVYWGVGPEGDAACDNCCAVCGDGGVMAVTLTD